MARWCGLALALAFGLQSVVARADIVEECASGAERAADLRSAGKLRDALGEFAACARDACPKLVRNDCRNAVAQIKETAPRLLVRVKDDKANDAPSATVSVDGVVLDDHERLYGMLVDPGSHVVRTIADGFAPVERVVVVTVADGARPIDVTLTREGPSKTPPTQAAAAPESPAAPASPSRRGAYVAGGVGLALVAIGGALGISTLVSYEDLKSRCQGHCADSEVSGAHTRGIVADVALGTGVLALGVAAYLWFSAPRGATTTAMATW
jgi:hypothetical protein